MCPTYDFECDCKHKISETKLISKRNDSVICPKCNKTMTRLIGSGGGFNFIGDGFYCNRKDDSCQEKINKE